MLVDLKGGVRSAVDTESQTLTVRENIRYIQGNLKAQRLSWFGHINRMPETSIVKRIRKWKPFRGRLAGRPKSR